MSSLPMLARVTGEAGFSDPAPRPSRILGFATARRKRPTPSEARLEVILNQLNGGVLRGRFKREHAISGKWIVDFFFPEIRLAIEVDGSFHQSDDQIRKDAIKEADCARFDITLLRITNAEVAGHREKLVRKLRAGWRQALARKNRIIGLSEEAYRRRAAGTNDEAP